MAHAHCVSLCEKGRLVMRLDSEFVIDTKRKRSRHWDLDNNSPAYTGVHWWLYTKKEEKLIAKTALNTSGIRWQILDYKYLIYAHFEKGKQESMCMLSHKWYVRELWAIDKKATVDSNADGVHTQEHRLSFRYMLDILKHLLRLLLFCY